MPIAEFLLEVGDKLIEIVNPKSRRNPRFLTRSKGHVSVNLLLYLFRADLLNGQY
jgi:hypothetical protein